MLKIYVAPNGHKYQYEEGQQPADHVLYEPKPKAAPRKRRTAANKAQKPSDK